jgi:hypothetical protein
MSRKARQVALEALEGLQTWSNGWLKFIDEIQALRQALETEQEPVAWRTFDGEGGYDYRSYEMNETYDKEWSERNPNHKGWVEPLYTAPPKREWVGLTDEQVEDEWERITGHSIFGGDRSEGRAMHISPDEVIEFSRTIEQALKEKNT